MTTKPTENELFEQWYKTTFPLDDNYDMKENAIAKHAWQARAELAKKEQATIVTQIDAVKFQEALDAMCADKDKQIAELQAQIDELREAAENYILEGESALSALEHTLSATPAQCLQEQSAEITQYKAQINELREALEDISKLPYTSYKWGTIAAQALAKTAPQCLQEHDNEVIEKIAYFVSNQRNDIPACGFEFAEAIRALKGKQNG